MNRTTTLSRALSAFALAAALLPGAAEAQGACAAGETRVAAGDARLAAFVPEAADTVDMWVERDTAVTPMGTYFQHVAPVKAGGGDAWLVVQRTEMRGRTMVDSVTVRAGSWAPLRHAAVLPGHTADLAFADGRVRGTVADSGRARAVDTLVAPSALDYSIVSVVLPALPLCEGRVVRFDAYDVGRGPVSPTATVVGAERVTLRGKTWDAWAVDFDTGRGTSRLYVDRATGRQVGWMVRFPDGRAMKGATRLPVPGAR